MSKFYNLDEFIEQYGDKLICVIPQDKMNDAEFIASLYGHCLGKLCFKNRKYNMPPITIDKSYSSLIDKYKEVD